MNHQSFIIHNNPFISSSIPKKKRYKVVVKDELKNLRTGIWVYFFLLIFEGALRKWVLPALSTPLLIIRDPVALYLILVSFRKGLLPVNVFLSSMMAIGIIGVLTAVLVGHHSMPVAIYGARIFLIHFPLIFVIGSVFSLNDVIKLGRVLIFLSIPMILLIGVQFYSPQSAWINRGIGGNVEGGGFSGALGYFRPPGTFSFTSGNSLFFGFVAAYLTYFLLNPKIINKVILIAAVIGLIASIPLSISRTLLGEIGISVLFTLVIVSQNSKYLGRILIGFFAVVIILAILGKATFFQTATEAFTSRFETANESEGGVQGVFFDRFLGGMIGALSSASDLPFWGYGLGMGTNAGAMLLTGTSAFLISEGEWGRLIGELGPLLGIAVILIRVRFCFKIAYTAYSKLRQGNALPWLLLSFGLLLLAQGQWAQPTALGFSILSSGLVLASLGGVKVTNKNSNGLNGKIAKIKRL